MRYVGGTAIVAGLALALSGCGASEPSPAHQQEMRDRAAELIEGEPGRVLLHCDWGGSGGVIEFAGARASDCTPMVEVPADPAAIRAALFWVVRNGTVGGAPVVGTFAGDDVYLEGALIVVPDGAGGLDSVGWRCVTDYQVRKEPETDDEVKLGTCRLTRGPAPWPMDELITPAT